MISVYGEQTRSLCSKQSKLNFWNQLHPKIVFLCRLLTKTATWRPNHTILTKSVEAILEAMTDTVIFGTKFRGVRILSLRWEVFPTRESTLGLTGWTLSYLFRHLKFWGLHYCQEEQPWSPPSLYHPCQPFLFPFCSLFALFTYYTTHMDITFWKSEGQGTTIVPTNLTPPHPFAIFVHHEYFWSHFGLLFVCFHTHHGLDWGTVIFV